MPLHNSVQITRSMTMPTAGGNLQPQQVSSRSQSKIRDVIINNFVRKHLPPIRDPSDKSEIERQIRVTKMIGDYVDGYLSNKISTGGGTINENGSTVSNAGGTTVRTVKALEEQLLQIVNKFYSQSVLNQNGNSRANHMFPQIQKTAMSTKSSIFTQPHQKNDESSTFLLK